MQLWFYKKTSLPSVASKVAGIVQMSGDAFGPTTGFLDDPTENLELIAGYNNCDMKSEDSKDFL